MNIKMMDGDCCTGRRVVRICARFLSGHEYRHSVRVVIRSVAHRIAWSLLDMTELRNVALILFCAIPSGLAQTPQPAPTPSIVYSVHDPGSIKDYKTNPRIVHEMVNRLVLAATGQPDVGKAWASLVSPTDRVGIKISAAGGELFTTHRDIVNAIVDGLAAAGHARNSIIVWDRALGGIKEAGYRPDKEGYQLRSIAPRDGYDPKAVFSAPLSGPLIWGDLDFRADRCKVPLSVDADTTSDNSHFSRILSSDVTKIINVPVMSDSTSCGIAGCLYNVTIPNIDNWRRFTQSNWGHAAIAEIYKMPIISSKVVLNIMDGLVAQYAGGPGPQPNFAIHHATILASKDPVAIDALTVRQIEEWRAKARWARRPAERRRRQRSWASGRDSSRRGRRPRARQATTRTPRAPPPRRCQRTRLSPPGMGRRRRGGVARPANRRRRRRRRRPRL